MLKVKFLSLLLFFFTCVYGQNIQLHYDMGKQRNYVTTTFEIFKPDSWGNTFFFVDYDFNFTSQKHTGLAYMEIARCITLGKNTPISAHIEFDAGLMAVDGVALPINNAFLAGIDYGWHNNDNTQTFNAKLLYKNIVGKNPFSFQLTGVWDMSFYKRTITFAGFADCWLEDNTNFIDAQGNTLVTPTNTTITFVAEPQLWYNFTPNLSVGSEVELACNFGSVNGWKVYRG